MSKCKLLDDLVNFDLGLSEDEGKDLYMRMLADAHWCTRIAKEVGLAFSDTSFSWVIFFDEHDLYASDSESDARIYAERIIAEPLRLTRE